MLISVEIIKWYRLSKKFIFDKIKPITMIKIAVFVTGLLAFSGTPSQANSIALQEKKSDKGNQQVKLLLAKDKYINGEYKAALDLYRDLLGENKEDAMINYRVGRCLHELGQYNIGLEYFEKAFSLKQDIDSDIEYYLGRAYHRTGQIDKALKSLENFKNKVGTKRANQFETDWYIAQCNSAKELMNKPVEVKIENAGEKINSEYDDYAPSISADGKTMIFTSRRAETKGGGIDVEADRKYFEDIYITTWNDEKNTWEEAEQIKGNLNTEGHDASLSLSPDGKQIFIYRNVEDETRSGDICVSKLNASGKWSAAHPIPSPVNSSYFESSASITPDGNVIYFVSERKGGIGNGDIWMSKKINKHDWGEPVNLGAVVNTIEDEVSVFIHPDGKTLFFSSRGHNSMGGYDVFKSVRDDKGNWTKPENVGYPINTVNDDLHFILSTDNKTGYYSTIIDGRGKGERDIYKVDMSKYKIVKGADGSDAPHLGIIQGKVFDSNTGVEMEAEVVIIETGTNTEVGKTDALDGNFFFTLPVNKDYTVKVKKQGFKDKSESFDLKLNKNNDTPIINKSILLEKN